MRAEENATEDTDIRESNWYEWEGREEITGWIGNHHNTKKSGKIPENWIQRITGNMKERELDNED